MIQFLKPLLGRQPFLHRNLCEGNQSHLVADNTRFVWCIRERTLFLDQGFWQPPPSGEVCSKVTAFFTELLTLRVDEAIGSKQSQAVTGHNGNNSHSLGRKGRKNDDLQNTFCQMCPRWINKVVSQFKCMYSERTVDQQNLQSSHCTIFQSASFQRDIFFKYE